jgi:hypothetical protein
LAAIERLIVCLITAINLGVGPQFLSRWLKAWAVAFPIVVPTIMLVRPFAMRLSERLVARS